MISFVCGQLCSGKTLYAKALASINDGFYIEVGDIVRKIKNSENRTVLQDSKDLASKIAEVLLCKYIDSRPKELVVSGIRQKEILEHFPGSVLLWIDCPYKERKKRYLLRQRYGDEIPFEAAEKGDIDLGILEVKQYILERE
jgi:cytidylate kinase